MKEKIILPLVLTLGLVSFKHPEPPPQPRKRCYQIVRPGFCYDPNKIKDAVEIFGLTSK